MALSELDMMNLWAKQLTGYKSQWERLFGFGYAIEAEVRKDDAALIRQLVEALEGYRRNHNDGQPCDAERAGRARLLDSDLSKLTDRGAKAWAGIDAQKLREGKVP